MENFSGNCFARVFGIISPKVSTTRVITMVESVGAKSSVSQEISFARPTKKRVARVADRMFTMLLPTSMVDIRVS